MIPTVAQSPTVNKRFPGIWAIGSHPLAYRVLQKCACSSIGQVMHYMESGRFYPGIIHDDQVTLKKWGHSDSAAAVIEILSRPDLISFTFVRNPYRRLLSAFADKMFGYEPSGLRYRDGLLHRAAEPFGVRFDPDSDMKDCFNNFTKFVAATMRDPQLNDWHWSGMAHHLRYNVHTNPDWSLSFVGIVEELSVGLDWVVRASGLDPAKFPKNIPRENTTSIGFTCEEIYTPESIELVSRIYADDFDVFGYSKDISVEKPMAPIDAAVVMDRLRKLHGTKGVRL